ATRGAALFAQSDDGVQLVRGAGECERWAGRMLPESGLELVRGAIASAHSRVRGGWPRGDAPDQPGYAYAAALPIPRATGGAAALLLVGDARNPFAALDDAFLVALGQQIGSALDGAELTRRLQARTAELARLSSRMIEQHEEERRRI